MPLTSPTPDKSVPGRPEPGLYVVATPIGNLADITLRAIDILSRVDLIAAEDTRHTRRLLAAHGIDNKLISYHEHNEHQRARELIQRLDRGACLALVSNAGTPLVSDPGYRLITGAIAHGIPVIPIPGVSAATAALSVSGLPTDAFTFVGFPARKKTKRLQQLQHLAALPQTLIFYQAPLRLGAFVDELLAQMGDRPAVLGREMTKLHEEFIHGPLSHIQARIKEREAVRGECTLLVGGAAPAGPPDAGQVEKMLRTAMARTEGPLGEMVKSIASELNMSKRQVYDLALRIKREG